MTEAEVQVLVAEKTALVVKKFEVGLTPGEEDRLRAVMGWLDAFALAEARPDLERMQRRVEIFERRN